MNCVHLPFNVITCNSQRTKQIDCSAKKCSRRFCSRNDEIIYELHFTSLLQTKAFTELMAFEWIERIQTSKFQNVFLLNKYLNVTMFFFTLSWNYPESSWGAFHYELNTNLHLPVYQNITLSFNYKKSNTFLQISINLYY